MGEKLKLPSGTPTRFGVVLYPGFELLDVSGPIEALITFARQYGCEIELSIIAEPKDPKDENKDPAATGPWLKIEDPESPDGWKWKEWDRAKNCHMSFTPTHTFANAPELDVLLVPGGYGSGPGGVKNSDGSDLGPVYNDPVTNFIKERYPRLQYLITVCTGSYLAAKAGVLDNHSATTNKSAWHSITTAHCSKKTNWVLARWVRSGNIWTTSGVSAGIDGFFAWMAYVYGDQLSYDASVAVEYELHTNWKKDPFAHIYGDKDVPYPSKKET